MRALLQRVTQASIEIDRIQTASIQQGLVLFLGIEDFDNQSDIDWIIKKIVNLRVFNDLDHKMNLSLLEIEGEILLVSQFTLFADTKKGNRPGFTRAAKPEIAIEIYEQFKLQLQAVLNNKLKCGIFGADMQIALINNGPVTILIDSKNKDL